MNRIKIILSILLFSFTINGQTHWLQAKTSENGKAMLFDHMSTKNIGESEDVHLINYNPSLTFKTDTELDFALEGMNQCNIFTVYAPSLNVKEELIWKISNQDKDQLLLTDKRIADLSQGKFMNFVGNDPLKAQVNSYHHYRNTFAADQLTLASHPSDKEIPVGKYEGNLAELIVFNHKLAPISQQVLEGHLALKYSIPLNPGLDYLNGKGKEIWNYRRNEAYSFNIAGIGRSDELRFHQKQSKSELGDGHIAFGIQEIEKSNDKNLHRLQNQDYLLWGDNNAIIDFDEIYQDVHLLQRIWKIKTERFTSSHKLAFQLNHKGLDKSLEEDNSYWLITSKKPLDEVEINSSKVYPLSKEGKTYNGRNIELEDLSYFSIIKAPNLWMQIELDNPKCGTNKQGKVLVKPIGGITPYIISIKNKDGHEIENQYITNDDEYSFDNLEADQYILEITDGNNNFWKTQIHLNSSGLPNIDLPRKMILNGEETIFLDPNLEIDQSVDYLWSLPNGGTLNDSDIEITTSGLYTLLVKIGECKLWHQIEVIQESNNIASTSIFPNPTTNGYFIFSGELKEPTPYTITITDLSGNVITNQSHLPAKYISYTDWIRKDGMYIITLTSNNTTRSEKLVVISEQ